MDQYTVKEFSHQDAFNFGMKVLEIVEEKGLKPVRIRVVSEEGILFQYMMDGKVGEEWLNRKQNTVLESGHSSLYVYNHQDDYKELLDDDHYAICGGGIPVYVDDVLKAVLIVSGLAHTEDHQLIVDAIERM